MFSAMRYSILVMVMVCLGLSQGVRGNDTPQWAGDPYLLPNDPVTDEPLAEVKKPVVYDHDGREIRFVSQGSLEQFQADPTVYIEKIDQQMIEQQLPLYPLKTCVNSGKELGGEMGEPANFIYKNRLIRFCCAGCKKSFLKNQVAMIQQIDTAAIAAQLPTYPTDTCFVSDEGLEEVDGSIDRVYGNRLFRFCCQPCIKKFLRKPHRYLDKL